LKSNKNFNIIHPGVCRIVKKKDMSHNCKNEI
jgi:hypothetical protein